MITEPLEVHDSYADPLSDYMEAMTNNVPAFFYKEGDTLGGSYSLNLKKLGEYLKLQCIQETIKNDIGTDALRIWRVLMLNGKLDDKQVILFYSCLL